MASKTVMRPIYMSVLMSAMRFQSSRRNFPSILNLFFLSVNASFLERFPEKCSTFHSNAELYKGIRTHV